MHKNHPEAGYSLVELAIVLVIVGLIIGGVLKGRDLIDHARLKAAYAQVQSFRLAHASFVDRFHAMPGDFNQASKQIHASLKDGNRDNVIAGNGLEKNSQALQYWLHLAEADLISHPGTCERAAPGFGHGAPEAKIGGGFTVGYSPDGLKGHWYILGRENGNKGNGALLTPKQAFYLDKSFSNGNPSTGDFRIRQGQGQNAGKCLKADASYNLDEERPACVAYFKF